MAAQGINNNILYGLTMETVLIRKDAIQDLIKVKEEFDAIIESLELMGDKEFMKSYKCAKEQIRKREFTRWDDL